MSHTSEVGISSVPQQLPQSVEPNTVITREEANKILTEGMDIPKWTPNEESLQNENTNKENNDNNKNNEENNQNKSTIETILQGSKDMANKVKETIKNILQ